MIRTAALLLTGNAFSSLILFARNLVVVRLISIEDYGIAATFLMALSVLEMASHIGLQRLIVQDKRGEDPAFQASLQGFHLVRAVVISALLFLCAGLIADFFRIPEQAWAFQVLAIARLADGFMHFDLFRAHRSMNFRSQIIALNLAYGTAFLAIFPLALLFDDYRVMLFSIVLQFVVLAGISHALAERRYTLALDPKVIRYAFSFGWPLMLNGGVLFAVYNAEKLIVARALDLTAMALVAMGVTLTLTPSLILIRTLGEFFLPKLSEFQDNPVRFSQIGHMTVQAHLLGGMVVTVATAIATIPLIVPILGPDFAPLTGLLPLFAALEAIRICRGAAGPISVARGYTRNDIITNLVRVAFLPVGYLAIVNGYGLTTLIGIGILAETSAACFAYGLIARRIGFPLSGLAIPFGTFALFIAVFVAVTHNLAVDGLPPVGLIALAGAALVAATAAQTAFWREAKLLLRK